MRDDVVAFDINETLLDLTALDAPFAEVFGAAQARGEWFAQLLNLAMTASLAGTYDDFTALGRAALAMVAAVRGVTLSEPIVEHLGRLIAQLPAHADAHGALDRLHGAGFRLAALTNSSPDVVHKQLDHAGLTPFFEVILSADTVRRFKPAPEPYRLAASRLGVPTSRLRMVAAHNWDITGAMAAGCKGAFVARDGALFNPLVPQPDVIAPTLQAVAEAIVAVGGQRLR